MIFCWTGRTPHAEHRWSVLQETRRGLGRTDGSWKAGKWHFITTADPEKRYAGVCICVSETVATADQLIRQTRMLHAHIQGQRLSVDVVGVY